MMVASLLDKLKTGRREGRKGSKVRLVWNDAERADFEALSGTLSLQMINAEWPFVLRTDASNFAGGAVLEQVPRVQGMPTLADVAAHTTVPGAFMSRKMATPHQETWTTREKVACAVVSAL